MNLIYFLLHSSWQMLLLAIVTGCLSGGSSAGLIALISRTMGSDTNVQSVAIALRGAPFHYAIAWGFLGLALIALLTSIMTRVILIYLSQNAVFELQMRLSRQILASELTHLEFLGSPRLLATLVSDVQTIAEAVSILPFLCINIAIVIGCLLYIIWLSWQVFVMVMGLAIVALSSCRFLLRRGRRLLALAREEQDGLFGHFRTLTAGIKELKLHYLRRQDFLNADLQATATSFRRHNVRGLTFFAATDSWGKLIFFFAIGFVLFVLPHLINFNRQTLVAYVVTFTYLIGPMENIVNKLPLLSKADVALHKIQSLGLSLTSHGEENSLQSNHSYSWKHLELKGVTHTYQSDQEDINFTLGPVNLTMQPGEVIFIIGGNGSGKSTLAKLITGLYAPQMGTIYLDQQPIEQHNREWYRQHFAVVFADFYLFDRLVGFETQNLDMQAQNYLQSLQLEHKVQVSKGKFSTTALSQGQRKRLALLTAYLEDRPIYLFDEWAADQDPTFKKIFYTQFLADLKARGKTVLVISHDDSYFHVADRVIKLDYGQLIAEN